MFPAFVRERHRGFKPNHINSVYYEGKFEMFMVSSMRWPARFPNGIGTKIVAIEIGSCLQA